MTYRILAGVALCLVTGCTTSKPLPFASTAQRFGYGNEASLRLEPFAELQPARGVAPPATATIPGRDIQGPLSPSVSDIEGTIRPAVLPVYDETKDPNVTAVLLPEVTKADLDGTYRRGPSGKIELPPSVRLPIIETESVRAALLSAED